MPDEMKETVPFGAVSFAYYYMSEAGLRYFLEFVCPVYGINSD